MASLAGMTNIALAVDAGQTDSPPEDKIKTIDESRIGKLLQVLEFEELMDAILKKTEREGFEPSVQSFNRTTV